MAAKDSGLLGAVSVEDSRKAGCVKKSGLSMKLGVVKKENWFPTSSILH